MSMIKMKKKKTENGKLMNHSLETSPTFWRQDRASLSGVRTRDAGCE